LDGPRSSRRRRTRRFQRVAAQTGATGLVKAPAGGGAKGAARGLHRQPAPFAPSGTCSAQRARACLSSGVNAELV